MSAATRHPVEVELKYRVVDLAAAERYLVADEIGGFSGTAAPRSTQLEDRYVDTADGAMARAGFAVRLRQSGRGTMVSIKSLAKTNGAGGSSRREEIEGPADRTAGPLEWPASDARSLVLELAGDAPLVELVTIRQLRRKRVVRDGDTRVELSLDEVDVVARSRVVDRFVELEAELVKGDEARLTGLSEVFVADPGLAPSTGSKFEAAMSAVRAGSSHHGTAEAALEAVAAAETGDAAGSEARPTRSRHRGSPGPGRRRRRTPPRKRRRRRRPTSMSSRRPPTSSARRSRSHRRRTTGWSSGARPASPPTTTSPKPAARSCASTSPG